VFATVLLSVGTQTASMLATPPTQVTPPALRLAGGVQSADLHLVQDSPLFYSTRHFYSAPIVTGPATPAVPTYRLVGTFIIPNKPALAFLKSDTTGASRKVAPGETLDGWRVQAVENRRVVIQFGQESREIVPAGASSQVASAAPPPSQEVTAQSSGAPARPAMFGGPVLRSAQAPIQAPRGAVSGMRPIEKNDPARSGYVNPRQRIDVSRLYRGPHQ
jgi:hypothetical protein